MTRTAIDPHVSDRQDTMSSVPALRTTDLTVIGASVVLQSPSCLLRPANDNDHRNITAMVARLQAGFQLSRKDDPLEGVEVVRRIVTTTVKKGKIPDLRR